MIMGIRALFSIILLTLVLLESTSILYVFSQNIPSKIIYIYFPGSDMERVLAIVRDVYGNGSQVNVYTVEPDQDVDPLQYLYWLTTGAKPTGDLGSTTPYTLVNQSRVLVLWNSTGLVNNPFVDPSIHPYAFNPLFNTSRKYIPPRIISLRANTSFYWDELGSDVNVNLSSNILTVEIVKHGYTWSLNTSLTNELTPPRILVLVNDTGMVSAGNYTMSFYVVNASADNITLFFPGSLEMSSGVSSGLNKIIQYTVQWFMVSREIVGRLPVNATAWWLNQTMMSLSNIANLFLANPNVTSILVYVPQMIILRNAVNGNPSTELVNAVYSGFKSMLLDISNTYKGSLLAVFSPGDKSGNGYLVTVGGSAQLDMVFTSSQLASLLWSTGSLTPVGSSILLKVIAEKNNEVNDLTSRLNELNITLSSQNQKINELNQELAACRSENTILNTEVTSVKTELEKAQSLYNQAYTYITLGIAVTLAITALIGFLVVKTVSRKQ